MSKITCFFRWVEGKTLDKIQGLLPAGSIDATTRMALVNAAYFKGIICILLSAISLYLVKATGDNDL